MNVGRNSSPRWLKIEGWKELRRYWLSSNSVYVELVNGETDEDVAEGNGRARKIEVMLEAMSEAYPEDVVGGIHNRLRGKYLELLFPYRLPLGCSSVADFISFATGHNVMEIRKRNE